MTCPAGCLCHASAWPNFPIGASSEFKKNQDFPCVTSYLALIESCSLSAPTLQDLLNPAPPNEELEFLIADPYGVQALGAEEDDEEDGPVIICDSDLIRLKLKTLSTFRTPNSSHITWKIQLQNLQCLHCMHIAQP